MPVIDARQTPMKLTPGRTAPARSCSKKVSAEVFSPKRPMAWLPGLLMKLTTLSLLLSGCTVAATDSASRPGWATKFLADPPKPWGTWVNTLAPKGKAAPPLRLATEGKTDYVIVIPEKPTRPEQRAANELQLWLGKITGATFAIVPDTQPAQARELCVGQTNRRTDTVREQEQKAGEFGYAIAVENERLFLVGAGLTGSMLATFALLEEDFGVRWYSFPPMTGKSWTDKIKMMNSSLNAMPWAAGHPEDDRVPQHPTLSAGIVPRISKPGFNFREMDFQSGSMPDGLRNRINCGWATQYSQYWYPNGSSAGHSFHYLVPPKKYFDAHPEYFSLVNGKRQWEHAQLCLANPMVVEIAAKQVIDDLRASSPTRRMFDISPMDWAGHCECEHCLKIEKETGAWSGVLLTFVNQVAKLVEKELPDATITTISYWKANRPPTADIKANANVCVRYCLDWGAQFTWPYHSFYDEKLAAEPDKKSDPNQWTAQRQSFARWQEISPRMGVWMYPSQYRNSYAPMPNLRAVAENIRYFSERNVEKMYIQPGTSDLATRPMRQWVFAKLLWDPTLDVEDLIRDYIWGYYGAAAPAVYEYYNLLSEYCAHYSNFSRERDWIYAIDEEEMFRHGFGEKARDILERALAAADSGLIRQRIELHKLGVVYVEAAQLFVQMRKGENPPESKHYLAITDELDGLCRRLNVEKVNFNGDAIQKIEKPADFIAEMRKAMEKRLDQRYLPIENWGGWTFTWDPLDEGVAKQWYEADFIAAQNWTPVKVPAFLSDTPVGIANGYGWYRTTFMLTAEQAKAAVELEFGAVDEQAWVYVNGKSVGEHTLKSEFIVGQEITAADLRDKPFKIILTPERLKAGENVLVVRIHNSAENSGIHKPVQLYLASTAPVDACDGSVLSENFAAIEAGSLPSYWNKMIQIDSLGRPTGIAGVSHHFVASPSLHLRDSQAHVAVWSVSDEALPADNKWAVQFDFRLTGKGLYKASAGAAFGLKRGKPGKHDNYLPLLQLDNNETAGKPITLLGLGEVIDSNLKMNTWYRLVIRRDGKNWSFYVNGELKKTVVKRDTDLRGYFFGSFHDWPHVAEDIHYANLKIGNFILNK